MLLSALPRPCAATLTSDTTYNKPFKLPCASHTPPFPRPLYPGSSKVQSSFDGQNFFRFINWLRYNPWQSFFRRTEPSRNYHIAAFSIKFLKFFAIKSTLWRINFWRHSLNKLEFIRSSNKKRNYRAIVENNTNFLIEISIFDIKIFNWSINRIKILLF